MLIQTNSTLKAGDVVCLKLVSSEEVIARVKAIDVLKITVTKPVTLQVQQVGPGQMGIGFAPFMISAEDAPEIVISRDKLLVEPVLANTQVKNGYTKATSNIEIAPAIPGVTPGA